MNAVSLSRRLLHSRPCMIATPVANLRRKQIEGLGGNPLLNMSFELIEGNS